jgi:tetratricopeptide (TPR) repeat protein
MIRTIKGVHANTLKIALAAALAVGSIVIPHQAHADPYWDMELKAKTLEKAGKKAEAAPYWAQLVTYYSGKQIWTNAALYAKSLGKYYDSISSYELAIKYYELENTYWQKTGNNWGAEDMGRAEQIRTTLDIYVSTSNPDEVRSLAASRSGGLAKFEPESGMYIGMYSEQDPLMGNFFTRSQSIYGRNHALYLCYSQWGVEFPARYAQNAKAAGAGLQIGWEPHAGLDAVQDGAYIRQWARAAKASGIPIFLRYASEMNGGWVKWNGDPKKYIEKFRLVAKIMHEEAPNVAMVWSPGNVPKFTMAEYYPGDEAVDWVGVSLYTSPYSNGIPGKDITGSGPIEGLEELYSLYADRKPIMLSETAVTHLTHRDNKSFTDWALMNLSRLYEIMPIKYPRLKAITYFNVDMQQDSMNDYLLRDNPAMMEAYKRMIANPNFLSSIATGTKPARPSGYMKAGASASFTRSARLVAYAKTPDIYIGKLEFVLNGKVVATRYKAPFELSLNAGDVPAGSWVAVRVYNSAGKKITEKSIGLTSVVSVTIDGRDKLFEQPPIIMGGATLAPLRAIFESLGASVTWDPDTRTATGVKGSTTVVLQIGANEALVNGVKVILDQPAQLVNGFTMAPARFVGETFGGKVGWDGSTRTVGITTQ